MKAKLKKKPDKTKHPLLRSPKVLMGRMTIPRSRLRK